MGSGVRWQRGRVLGMAAPLGSLFSEGIGAPGLSTHVWPSASVDCGLRGPCPLWTVDRSLWTVASVDRGLCGPSPPWTVPPWTVASVTVPSVDRHLCGGCENIREEEAFEMGGRGQRLAALHALC